MRTENGQFIKGISGNPKGRPKRADEQVLVDLWESDGQRVLSDSVKKGEQWAIKLLVDKLYSNKKSVDANLVTDTNLQINLVNYSTEVV